MIDKISVIKEEINITKLGLKTPNKFWRSSLSGTLNDVVKTDPTVDDNYKECKSHG